MNAAHVTYRDVPAEVSRVAAYAWQQGTAPVPLALAVARDGRQFVLSFSTSSSAIVLWQREDGAYMLDGPVAPRDAQGERALDRVWRRTVTGASNGGFTAPLEWLSGAGSVGDTWPSCWWNTESAWTCLGVPLGAAGVVFNVSPGGVGSVPVTANVAPMLRQSAWARLLMIRDRGEGTPPKLRVTAARPLAPAQRARALRVDTAPVGDVRINAVEPGVYWLAGDSSPPDAWLEIRSTRSGPQYVPLEDVAQGAPQLPLSIVLEDRRDLETTVLSSGGDAAAGAFVTVFRVIDPDPPPPGAVSAPPRRVLAAEKPSAANGTATIEGLGDADYELVAWHPQLGRAVARIPPGATRVTVRLHASGIARGRVLVGGKPTGGVDVLSAPDPAAYAAAADPVDAKGGDARTAADGRFWVTLAPDGGGELRIGGSGYPIARVPLPRAPLPVVELGDIELGRPLAIVVALDQDPGCDLRATGPVGRPGLQILAATRTAPGLFALTLPEEGSWEFVLLCGREERALAPAVVRVSARDGPRDVRLSVR